MAPSRCHRALRVGVRKNLYVSVRPEDFCVSDRGGTQGGETQEEGTRVFPTQDGRRGVFPFRYVYNPRS